MRLSISRIRLFKACRRAYELRYIEDLVPVEKAESLQTGTSYHEKLEQLYRDGDFDASDLSKESAMVTAYRKYIYPKVRIERVEDWMSYRISEADELIGRADGIAEDGRLVEHKTTSSDITAEYEYLLQWDEQILAYMLMTGAREIWYTVCRKPTIRQKKGESEEDFFNRMVAWYDEDTESKIKVMLLSRTDEEVEDFRKALESMAVEMNCSRNYYRNTAHCKRYGRMCEYAPVCLYYDPEQEYIEFTRREEQNADS